MKKLFIALAFSALALWSCDDNKKNGCDDCNGDIGITDIVMPPSTEDILPGDQVTIQGKGFHEGDLIRGYKDNTRANTSGTPAFEVAVTSVTSNSATFKLPAGLAAGDYVLVVVRGGEAQNIGTLTVKDEGAQSAEYILYGGGYDTANSDYKLCGMHGDGSFDVLHTYTDDERLEGIVCDVQDRIWGFTTYDGKDLGFGCYDVPNKDAFAEFPNPVPNLEMLGLYNGGPGVLFNNRPGDSNHAWYYCKVDGFNSQDPAHVYRSGEGNPDLVFLKDTEFESTVFATDEVNECVLFGYTMADGGGSGIIAFDMNGATLQGGVVIEESSAYDVSIPFTMGTAVCSFDYSATGDVTCVNELAIVEGKISRKKISEFAGKFRCPVAAKDGMVYALKTNATTETSELYFFDPADWSAPTKVGSMPSWVFEITASPK